MQNKKTTIKPHLIMVLGSVLFVLSLNSTFAAVEEKRIIRNTVDVRLKTSAPKSYVVKKHDTLWGIAARFLQDPWIWPQIWDANPQIKNPHLIYPGDVITLIYVAGEAKLHVERPNKITPAPAQQIAPKSQIEESDLAENTAPVPSQNAPEDIVREETGKKTSEGLKVVKLSPRIRYQEQAQPIKAVEASAIQSFIIKPRILTKDQYEKLPYIVGNYEGRMISSIGNEVYARGLDNHNEYRYSIYHKGKTFVDPENQDILGYEAIYAGNAKVIKFGDPSTLLITSSTREILNGDRLMTADRSKVTHNLIPSISEIDFDGRIVALYDALTQSAQNQVVVINLGKRDGVEIGNVLSINRYGGSIVDRFEQTGDETQKNITVPDVRSGIMIVFKVFERVSYGLIMQSKRAIHINDAVSTPR